MDSLAPNLLPDPLPYRFWYNDPYHPCPLSNVFIFTLPTMDQVAREDQRWLLGDPDSWDCLD